MCKLTFFRNHLLPLFFLLFCRRHHHASFPNDVAARMTQHNNQFGVEATMPTAPMPTMMLTVTSSEGYHPLPGVDIGLVEKPFQHTCLYHLQDCVVNADYLAI
jgi:hypothetical protein